MKLQLSLIALSASLLISNAANAQCIDQNAPTNNACMAGFGQIDLAQSFKPTAGTCTGAGVFFSAGLGAPGTESISLWTKLPNVGGAVMLATGSGIATPGTWFDVSWASVAVTPGTTYYLVFSNTPDKCYAGDIYNGYPNGQVYANSGYGSFPGYDYTFRTFASCGGFVLSKSGTCPGSMTLSTTGGTANTNVAYVYGNAGLKTKPSGVCAGTTVNISNPKKLAIAAGNGAGTSSFSFNASPALCGKTIQAVLIGAGPCTVSNTIIL